MVNWEEKLFTLHDDLVYRVDHCTCRVPAGERCATCRLDVQLRDMLANYIEAGKMKRPPDFSRPAPREPIDRMFQEAADAGFEPLTEEQAEDFREKMRGVSAAIHRNRRTA
jgi:hypothetical protein